MAYYFLHIPKTAGMSVRQLLAARFGDALCPATLLDHLLDPAVADRSWEAYAGHFGGAFRQWLGCELITFTILRDPLARTLSHFAHVKRDPRHPYHAHVRDQSLKEFCSDVVNYPLFQNLQARYVAGLGAQPLVWGRRLTEAERQRSYLSVLWEASTVPFPDNEIEAAARATLDACALVGVTEQFDVFWSEAQRLLGAPDAAPARVNVGDETARAALPEVIDTETQELIAAHTAIDRRLYDLAAARMASRA